MRLLIQLLVDVDSELTTIPDMEAWVEETIWDGLRPNEQLVETRIELTNQAALCPPTRTSHPG